MPRKYEQCYICEKYGTIEMRTPNRNPICRHCVYIMNKQVCKCQNKSYTYNEDKTPICKNCFIELCICVKCRNQRDGNKSPLMLCEKCLRQNKKQKHKEKKRNCQIGKLETCNFCNQKDIIKKSIDNKNICNSCYKKIGKQILCCSVCDGKRNVEHWENKKPICKKCYKTPPRLCNGCLKIKPLHSKKHQLCEICYVYKRNKENENIRIISLLRTRLSAYLRVYSQSGKTKTSDKYGINYQKIVEHLGPCPGDRQDYHIDHIFPLVAFDFNNPIHIKIAFCPENHRWLEKKQNLIKGDRYDLKEFQEFLNAKMCELS